MYQRALPQGIIWTDCPEENLPDFGMVDRMNLERGDIIVSPLGTGVLYRKRAAQQPHAVDLASAPLRPNH